MKKIFCMLLAASLAFGLASCGKKSGSDYPVKSINGVVQWGAGGGTDTLMRPLAALAEKELGGSIVVQNMTGATGSVATQFVYDTSADGYTLLMGAENPALYKALDISELTYEDFDCVFLVGSEVVGIAVAKDSAYESFSSLVNAALASPGTVKLSTTGKGGLPWTVAAFIKDITGATFNQIPYDSDASARTAVMSGECDFTVCKVQAGVELHKEGSLKFLTMFAEDTVAALPDVPVITDEYPDFAKYLPWGPFYGVFVKKGTDKAAEEKLGKAFAAAAQDESYRELMVDLNINALVYTGEKAAEFISSWQENTISALKNCGLIEE